MSTRIYPFQLVSSQLGSLTIQCQMPKEAAEKLASTLRSIVQLADGRWYYERTGVQGQEVHKNGPFRLLFGSEEKAKLDDEAAYIQDLQAFWNSLPNPITSENTPAVQEAANRLFEQHCPIVDKTETPEVVQARQAALEAAETAKQLEREKIIAAYADSPEEIPLEKGEMGIILALVHDNSDMMTDYYNPRSVKRSFLLARLRPQRRQEQVLRQIITRYPDLKAVAWIWHGSDKYSHGPDCYLKSKETFAYQGTPFKAYSGQEVTRVWYEIRFVRSGRYLPYMGFHTPVPEPTSSGIAPFDPDSIRIEHERDWTWLYFPKKPPEATRERLSRMGGQWGRHRRGWYFQRNVPDEEFAWLFEAQEPATEETMPEASSPPAVRAAAGPAGYVPGKGSAYEYMPPWMDIPPLYTAEKQDDPLAVVKIFTPDSSWSWFILEYDGKDTCFGLVVGLDTEFGYLSLREIREARGPLGVQPERDLWFCPTPVTQLPEYREKWGDGGPFRGGGGVASTPDPEPDGPLPPALPPASCAALPEGWTEEDVTFLLTQLELGPILVADAALGFPTIHDFPHAEHLGYGLFRVTGEGYTLSFDGGGAMRRTPSGKGWTPLELQGEYPYDLDAARATLELFLQDPAATPVHAETLTEGEAVEVLDETLSPTANPAQTLTTGMLAAMARVGKAEIVPAAIPLAYKENGDQRYFQGEHYLLLGSNQHAPEQPSPAWVWFTRTQPDEAWRCLPDPTVGPETCIGAFSLEEALEVAQRVTGLSFALTGAPAGLGADHPGAFDATHPVSREAVQVTGLPPKPAQPTPALPARPTHPEPPLPAPPESNLTPEVHAEFAQFELALLTGLVQKKNSAFYRALQAITHPGTLNLALEQVNGDGRRRELLLRRLHTLVEEV